MITLEDWWPTCWGLKKWLPISWDTEADSTPAGALKLSFQGLFLHAHAFIEVFPCHLVSLVSYHLQQFSGLIWLTCWTFSLKPSLHIKPSIPTFSLPPSTQQYLKTYLGAPGDSLSPTTSWFPQHQSQCLCLKEQDPVRAPWLLHHHSHLHVHLQRRWKVSGREPVKSQQPSHTIWDLGFWWAGHFLGYQAGQHDSSSSSFCRKELPSLYTFCYLFGAMVLGWAWVGSICSLRVL